MKDLIIPLIFLVSGASMLWPTKSRWSNIMGGVLIGAASMLLIEAHLPRLVNMALGQVLGLGWFVVLFGGLAAVMIVIFDRW